MASYGGEWDEDLKVLSREFFEKDETQCTAGELRALYEIKEARRRLAKVDAFIASLK